MSTVISVENVSKHYRLGLIGGRTLRADFERWWAKVRGKPNPLLKIGQEDYDNRQGEYIWALRDVSFEVQQGEVLGIIGRNGAGKSTLLKILSRVTAPTSGQVKVQGRVASLLEVGTGFHPELTGRENITLNGAILGMKRAEIDRKFDEIVDFAEIEKFIDTPVKRYSSGMYVRLAFAVAAHLEPEILLVDEVLAVGDAAFQKKCLGKMGDVAKEGRTVLFVSHNMGAIQGLCKRAIWINDGSIVSDGDPRSIVTQYLDSTNESFIRNSQQAHADFQDMIIEKVVLKNDRGETTTSFESGGDIIVEIHYNAANRVSKPYFWVGVNSQYGSLFAANMLFDDLRPNYVEGKGVVSCVFKNVRLLPQTFSVNVGARYQDGMRLLVPTIKSAAVLRIVGDAHDLGMSGELADLFLERATPMQVPYEWRFMGGSVAAPSWVKGDH